MCQVLKPLGQVFCGQFGLSLRLQLGQFPQNLTATKSTQHRLPCLGETAKEVRAYKLDTVFGNEEDVHEHFTNVSQLV